jgi:hypothetical protein
MWIRGRRNSRSEEGGGKGGQRRSNSRREARRGWGVGGREIEHLVGLGFVAALGQGMRGRRESRGGMGFGRARVRPQEERIRYAWVGLMGQELLERWRGVELVQAVADWISIFEN